MLVCCLCRQVARYSRPGEHFGSHRKPWASLARCRSQAAPGRCMAGVGVGKKLRQALGHPRTPGVLAANCSLVACPCLGGHAPCSCCLVVGTALRPQSRPPLVKMEQRTRNIPWLLWLMPRSQMAYNASATPLRRIFPQSLVMIVQFDGAGKAAAAIIAAPPATADSLARS